MLQPLSAGVRSSRCVRTWVPTSTKTPIAPGSVTRCDGRGVNRGSGPGSGSAASGRPVAPLPRIRGPLDQADRGSPRPLARDGQSVLLRPTGEEARAVKARYKGVCRGCGAYTQPRNGKGDAYAYCKACHPGAIERHWPRARVIERDDALLGSPLRPAAHVLRLVTNARAPARGRGAAAFERGQLAVGERSHGCVRELVGGAHRRWRRCGQWPAGVDD